MLTVDLGTRVLSIHAGVPATLIDELTLCGQQAGVVSSVECVPRAELDHEALFLTRVLALRLVNPEVRSDAVTFSRLYSTSLIDGEVS